MRLSLLFFFLLSMGIVPGVPGHKTDTMFVPSTKAVSNTRHSMVQPSSAHPDLIMFGRGTYPGDDSTFETLKNSGFTTIILSSFYIRANGDVFSGDDNKKPVIHDGKFVGNTDWLKRVASLKQKSSSVKRIEILFEGRWFNQPPNTYDYIKTWSDADSTATGITTGTGVNSTLYNIAKVLKNDIGIDAICIDDESVYNSSSVVRLGEMVGKMHMHMTLCPYTNYAYWKEIINGSKKGLVDAVYLQCYDGGKNNVPARWVDSLASPIPLYPVMLCRGSFSNCNSSHNSKTPDEIKSEMIKFKKDYPGMAGGAIWQMADVKDYIRKNCAVQLPESGGASTMSQYVDQLKNSLKDGL